MMMLVLLGLLMQSHLVQLIKFNKVQKHSYQYQSLKDIEGDMMIQKLDKFKNILQQNQKIIQINQTLFHLISYLENQKDNFEDYKNKIIQQNQILMEQFQIDDKQSNDSDEVFELVKKIFQDNFKEKNSMMNQQLLQIQKNLVQSYDINNITDSNDIFKKELLQMMIEKQLNDLEYDDFQLSSKKHKEQNDISALKQNIINITDFIESVKQSLSNFNKVDKLNLDKKLELYIQKDNMEEQRSFNKTLKELLEYIHNQVQIQLNIDLKFNNYTKIDFNEIEEELKPVIIKLGSNFQEVNYQSRVLLNKYEMFKREKTFLVKYLQKQQKNLNIIDEQQKQAFKIMQKIKDVRRKSLNEINKFQKNYNKLNQINQIKQESQTVTQTAIQAPDQENSQEYFTSELFQKNQYL